MQGTVFSIEEFSLFDGPGIRTAVFVKGCPMRCAWCHNPEGQSPKPEPICAKDGTRRICGRLCTPEQLCAELQPSLDAIRALGGITFTGGEVLQQQPFVSACIRLLKKDGIHIAAETSGFGSAETYRALISDCDLVLQDLKLIEPALHKRYTLCDNAQILENVRYLMASKTPYILRVPLIPGITDTESNLDAIAQFIAENGGTSVELLPYHTLTPSKYPLVGREYSLHLENPNPQPHFEIFSRRGITAKLL